MGCKRNVNKSNDYLGYIWHEIYGKDSTQTTVAILQQMIFGYCKSCFN